VTKIKATPSNATLKSNLVTKENLTKSLTTVVTTTIRPTKDTTTRTGTVNRSKAATTRNLSTAMMATVVATTKMKDQSTVTIRKVVHLTNEPQATLVTTKVPDQTLMEVQNHLSLLIVIKQDPKLEMMFTTLTTTERKSMPKKPDLSLKK